MKQYEANQKMVSLFEKMVKKAESAEKNDELTLFTDNAHKLYITLTNSGAFDSGFSAEFSENELSS